MTELINTSKRAIALCLLFLVSTESFGEDISKISIVGSSWEASDCCNGGNFYKDIFDKIYRQDNIDVEISYMPWLRAKNAVQEKRYDAVIGDYPLNDENLIYGKIPHDVEIISLITRKSSEKKWQTVESLKGQRVAYVIGYNYAEILNTKFNAIEVPHIESALNMLSANRIDIVLHDLATFKNAMRDLDCTMDAFDIVRLQSLPLYLGFQNTSKGQKLADIWDREIVKLYRSGELATVYSKYGYMEYFDLLGEQIENVAENP